MKKIKVLHLITGLGKGGAEKVVLDLCCPKRPDSLEQHVIGISEINEMLFRFEEKNIPVLSLNMKKNPFSLIKTIRILLKELNRQKYDLIHAHMTHAMVMACILKVFNLKMKIVFTPHNSYFGRNSREWILWALKPMRYIDILFSEQQKSFFHKKNYVCIPNGIPIVENSPSKEKYDIFTFLAVGRLEKMKNHISLVKMADSLRNKNYEFQILIAGTGTLHGALAGAIQKHHLENHIKLLGFRDDVTELCDKSHVFIMPSLWEGMPISILEAGVRKLPVISTPAGSIPSLLDETMAFLIELDNFEQRMEECIINYDHAKEKAELFYAHINSSFNLDVIIDRHLELYKQILSN